MSCSSMFTTTDMRPFFKWVLYILFGILLVVVFILFVARMTSYSREVRVGRDSAPSTGKFVHAADVDMFYQEWGPKDGQAVIFLHAAGGWSEVWKETGKALGGEGYHVIALDMPPLGYSQRPDDALYSREDQAKRIVGVMNALRIDKAVLVGHSFGGRAVAQVALQYPRRVKALVLVDAALSFKKPGEHASLLMRIVLALGPVRNAFAAATVTNPAFTHSLIKMFVANPASATDYWVSVYQTPLSLKGTTKAVGDWLPQLLAEEDSSLSSASAAYKNIQVPTLIVWGSEDHTTPLADGKYLASIIPGVQLSVMPGLGHLPPIEDTVGFDDVLLRFLKQM